MCSFGILFFPDMNSKEFRMFLPLENKSDHLFGHKFVCYKELIFLFGGEFLIGRGDWNTNLWAYDNIREKWERKCVLVYILFYIFRRNI